jgi:Ketopantoate reductase PanE/ApbA
MLTNAQIIDSRSLVLLTRGVTDRESTASKQRPKNQGDSTMQILVVGAGAVGSYFGGRLAQANRDVSFLVRAERAEELKTNGLRIVSPHGEPALHPKTINGGQISRPYDLILLGVKSYALSGAMIDFAPAVGQMRW